MEKMLQVSFLHQYGKLKGEISKLKSVVSENDATEYHRFQFHLKIVVFE